MLRILISYQPVHRTLALHVYDYLSAQYGAGNVILSGCDRPANVPATRPALDGCTVLVALLGAEWLRTVSHTPPDCTTLELRSALAHGIRVIPVLLEDAQMPHRLPGLLSVLSARKTLRLTEREFCMDTERLLAALDPAHYSAQVSCGESAESVEDIHTRRAWSLLTSILLVWMIISWGLLAVVWHDFVTIYEINLFVVLPLVTVLAAIIWPLPAGLGGLVVLVLHFLFDLVFMLRYLFEGQEYAGYSETWLVGFLSSIVVLALGNTLGISAICWLRRRTPVLTAREEARDA
jgi:hypothetical protein